MSRTAHHRKPGTPRRPKKVPIPRARHEGWTRDLARGNGDILPTFEPTHVRRTR